MSFSFLSCGKHTSIILNENPRKHKQKKFILKKKQQNHPSYQKNLCEKWEIDMASDSDVHAEGKKDLRANIRAPFHDALAGAVKARTSQKKKNKIKNKTKFAIFSFYLELKGKLLEALFEA